MKANSPTLSDSVSSGLYLPDETKNASTGFLGRFLLKHIIRRSNADLWQSLNWDCIQSEGFDDGDAYSDLSVSAHCLERAPPAL